MSDSPSTDLRKIGGIAVLLLVVLRLSIGWQFLYEGLWKWDTLSSSKPWTARGFLVNAQGPFRDHFRNMAGDPDDLGWLDFETVERRWMDWSTRFYTHYGLEPNEYDRLMRIVQGPLEVTAPAKGKAVLPEGVALKGRLAKLVTLKDDKLRLQTGVMDGDFWNPKYRLVPADRKDLLGLLDVKETSQGSGRFEGPADHVAFANVVHELYQRQSNLSYMEKLRASLLGDPERVTVVNEGDEFADSVDRERLGKIDQYRKRLAEYEAKLAGSVIEFQVDHREHEWGEIQALRADLVNPIKQLETDMKAEARRMLTAEQAARGPLPEPWTSQRIADWTAIVSLTLLGGLLMIGLCTRWAAFFGAGMLFTFYLVWPPLPGVPEPLGPEHALFVNKNMIEVLALLAIAALPSGRWFGVDALFGGGGSRKTAKNEPGRGKPTETDTRAVASSTAATAS